MLKLVQPGLWVNTDAIDIVQDNGNDTYKVTLRNGTIYPAVAAATVNAVFPELVPIHPPPPLPPYVPPPPHSA